jgi:hypothetical protein
MVWYVTYGEGLLDMSRNEIVIAILATRTIGFGSLGWEFGHALHCGDVVAFLGGSERSPDLVSAYIFPPIGATYHSRLTTMLRGLHFFH